MNQNNMINFITLTGLDDERTEVNPASIVMMQRSTYAQLPCTNVWLMLNIPYKVVCRETPEEIVQLQMDAIGKLVKKCINVFEELEREI